MKYTRYEFKGISSRRFKRSAILYVIAAAIFVILMGFILSRFIIIPGLTKLWNGQVKNHSSSTVENIAIGYINCHVIE